MAFSMAACDDPCSRKLVTLLLAGDVMTGRGIDQVLPHPAEPTIHEPGARSALDYVALAERAHSTIPRAVPFEYIWGDALAEFRRRQPNLSLVNLETAITARGVPEPKGINYRMHPGNIGVLTAAGIVACTLANNHVLDWGTQGLLDTLDALDSAGIAVAGAGRNIQEARAPLVARVPQDGRALVFAWGHQSSGIPAHWQADTAQPGLNLLKDLSNATVRNVADMVRIEKQPGDVVIASFHWGRNWGYDIPREQVAFAHALIDDALVDIVHGHSSHHPKAIEVYHGKLILYGCGDVIDDYEGISGYEDYRDDLVLMYFPTVSAVSGALCSLEMVPFRICKFRLQKADHSEAAWLAATLSREGRSLGTRLDLQADGTLRLSWE
jgi:poly-gamma-glutamate synthesis protein (capsule biosynthesis protein)